MRGDFLLLDQPAEELARPDPAQQVALQDHVIEPELVEKARLVSIPSPYHNRILLISFDQESSFAASLNPFFDSIGH